MDAAAGRPGGGCNTASTRRNFSTTEKIGSSVRFSSVFSALLPTGNFAHEAQKSPNRDIRDMTHGSHVPDSLLEEQSCSPANNFDAFVGVAYAYATHRPDHAIAAGIVKAGGPYAYSPRRPSAYAYAERRRGRHWAIGKVGGLYAYAPRRPEHEAVTA